MARNPKIISEGDPNCQHLIERISSDLVGTCKCGLVKDYKPAFTGTMNPPVSRKGQKLNLTGEEMLKVERIILEVD